MDSDGITWEIFLSNLFCPFQNLGEIRPLSHVGDRLKTLLTLYSRNEEEFCEPNAIIPLPPKSINFLHQLCSLLNEETESTARFSTVLAYIQGIRDGEEGHPWHVVSFVGFLARVLRPSTRVTFANVQNVNLKSQIYKWAWELPVSHNLKASTPCGSVLCIRDFLKHLRDVDKLREWHKVRLGTDPQVKEAIWEADEDGFPTITLPSETVIRVKKENGFTLVKKERDSAKKRKKMVEEEKKKKKEKKERKAMLLTEWSKKRSGSC